MSSDYWMGYAHGESKGKNTGDGGIGAAIAMVVAGVLAVIAFVASAGIAAYVVLYPLAALLVAASVSIMGWLFSLMVEVVWHDPSPYYLFGSHWLYFNPFAFIPAGLLGLWLAYAFVIGLEFELAGRPVYKLARHVWRVMVPSAIIAAILVNTQADTGISNWGLWLIPITVAVALHFGLWSEVFSVRKRWLEAEK